MVTQLTGKSVTTIPLKTNLTLYRGIQNLKNIEHQFFFDQPASYAAYYSCIYLHKQSFKLWLHSSHEKVGQLSTILIYSNNTRSVQKGFAKLQRNYSYNNYDGHFYLIPLNVSTIRAQFENFEARTWNRHCFCRICTKIQHRILFKIMDTSIFFHHKY